VFAGAMQKLPACLGVTPAACPAAG
jgi:hypothetical protein